MKKLSLVLTLGILSATGAQAADLYAESINKFCTAKSAVTSMTRKECISNAKHNSMVYQNALISVNQRLGDKAYASSVLAELQNRVQRQLGAIAYLPISTELSQTVETLEIARNAVAAGQWSKVSTLIKRSIQHIQSSSSQIR